MDCRPWSVVHNVYIYYSNEEETPLEVYFDDFFVEHVMSPVVQMDDYYPFGLTFNSYKRENSVENKIKFQGQEHIDDLNLGWVQFKWRNHMPEIGRFFNVDPLSDKYVYNSPYAFSENHVTSHVELEGLEKASIKEKMWALRNYESAQKIKANIDPAFSLSRKSGLPGPRDGGQDAFRHAMWSAMNARDVGENTAREFGNLHEDANNPDQDPVAVEMDKHNNEIGIMIGRTDPEASNDELASKIIEAFNTGMMVKISMDSDGNYLDADGNKIDQSKKDWRQNLVIVSSNTKVPEAKKEDTKKEEEK